MFINFLYCCILGIRSVCWFLSQRICCFCRTEYWKVKWHYWIHKPLFYNPIEIEKTGVWFLWWKKVSGYWHWFLPHCFLTVNWRIWKKIASLLTIPLDSMQNHKPSRLHLIAWFWITNKLNNMVTTRCGTGLVRTSILMMTRWYHVISSSACWVGETNTS